MACSLPQTYRATTPFPAPERFFEAFVQHQNKEPAVFRDPQPRQHRLLRQARAPRPKEQSSSWSPCMRRADATSEADLVAGGSYSADNPTGGKNPHRGAFRRTALPTRFASARHQRKPDPASRKPPRVTPRNRFASTRGGDRRSRTPWHPPGPLARLPLPRTPPPRPAGLGVHVDCRSLVPACKLLVMSPAVGLPGLRVEGCPLTPNPDVGRAAIRRISRYHFFSRRAPWER